jgi:hypothetical protein
MAFRNRRECSKFVGFAHPDRQRHGAAIPLRIMWGIIAVAVSGCVSGPGYVGPLPEQPRAGATIDAPLDRVWDAAIDWVGENNIAIRTLERASGFISTEPLYLGGGFSAKQWADCGKWVNEEVGAREVQLNILVRGDSARATLRVQPRFTSTYGFAQTQFPANCISRGVVEQLIEDFVRTRSSAKTSPDLR